jgi:diphthamide biosynthesis methyltransferase
MRDKRFIAEHRGGLLSKDNHRNLMKWACKCSEHVLPLSRESVDERLKNALLIAKEWSVGNAKVGDAMKASVRSHTAARELTNPISIAVARSIGQAVATAHMSDHSLGAAIYALKAVKFADKSIDEERKWQNEQLPSEIRDLVMTTRSVQECFFKDLKTK